MESPMASPRPAPRAPAGGDAVKTVEEPGPLRAAGIPGPLSSTVRLARLP